MTARKRVRIPRPPIHCVILLQKRIHLGIPSSPVNIVIPVVVNPLIASKNELR
jgi:hypothetical protein